MRDFAELNINERGKPVGRSSPTEIIISEFQSQFGVTLPQNYIKLLQHANGGHPEIDSIIPIGKPTASRWAVNRFYHLDDDKKSTASLWTVTEKWKNILGENAIPFAADSGGNQFYFDLNTSPPLVKICVHDNAFSKIEIAPSFEAFIDALSVDPDMI